MVTPDARRRLLERFRGAAPFCSVHAPYTDLEIGHRNPELAAASLRVLQEYVDIAADLGARHLNVHVGSFGLAPDERSWEGLLRNLTERDDTHVPPADPGELAGTLDLLRERGCEFWVLELLGREGLEQTRRVVDRYLAPENPKST